jgi:hypothetical protein
VFSEQQHRTDVLSLILQNKRGVDRVFEKFILLSKFEEDNELQILRRDVFTRRAIIESTFRRNSRINPATQQMDAWMSFDTVKRFAKQIDYFVSKIRAYLTIQNELYKRKNLNNTY